MNVHLTQGNHSTPDQNLQAEDINHRKKNMDDFKNDPPRLPQPWRMSIAYSVDKGKGQKGKDGPKWELFRGSMLILS